MADRKPKPRRVWTAGQLVELLRAKYSESGGMNGVAPRVFMEQVPNGTGGYGCRSWIDAVVIELWGSAGHTRRAFEVKADRGDFLREVANRGKNLWCREAFHEFWFVAPEGVVNAASEIPEGDGWLCPRGSGLTVKLQAKRREAAVDDLIVCALARAMLDRSRTEVEAAVKQALAEGPEHREALAWKLAAAEFISERAPGGSDHGDLWANDDHAKMVAGAKDRLLAAVAGGDPEKLWRKRMDALHGTIRALHRRLAASAGDYLTTVAGLQALLVSGATEYPGWGQVKAREWKALMKELEGDGPRPDPPADQVIEEARRLIARYDRAKAEAAHG